MSPGTLGMASVNAALWSPRFCWHGEHAELGKYTLECMLLPALRAESLCLLPSVAFCQQWDGIAPNACCAIHSGSQ